MNGRPLFWLILILGGAAPIRAQESLPAAAPPPQPAVTAQPLSVPAQPLAMGNVSGNVISCGSAAAAFRAEFPWESTWYTRIDYFHWNERLYGEDYVNEDGALATLGYTRRMGVERFRLEMFGGSVNYKSSILLPGDIVDPLNSFTNYLGMDGEFDLLLEPSAWPRVSFFAGIGTRFWFRDLPDDFSESGAPVMGYHETWWTTYPYVGVETRHRSDDGWEFYGSARIGCTAVNFQYVSYYDVILYPKIGLQGEVEGGVRGRRTHLAVYLQTFNFGESAVVRDTLQPESQLLTVGLKAGFSY
jgi:hypothetical protein